MLPSEVTIEAAVAAIKMPVALWKGRCHEVSALVNDALELGMELAYGAYNGPVVKGFYLPRAVFHRHGWLYSGELILDPTRWVFESVEPYIFTGLNREVRPGVLEYDLGNDAFRLEIESLFTPSSDPRVLRAVPLHIEDEAAVLFVEQLLGTPPAGLNLEQVFRLANMSRRTLGKHARPVYEAIVAAGQEAAIPIDNRNLVLGR